VRIFPACRNYDDAAGETKERYGGLADSIELSFPAGTPAGLQRELLTDIRRIPHLFQGFDTRW